MSDPVCEHKNKKQSTHLVPSQVTRPTPKDEHEPNNSRECCVERGRAGHGGEEAAGPAPAFSSTSFSSFVGLLLGMGRLMFGGVRKLAWAGYAGRECRGGVRAIRWSSSRRDDDQQRGCASDDRARKQELPQERTTDGVHVYASSTGPQVRERRVEGAFCWSYLEERGLGEKDTSDAKAPSEPRPPKPRIRSPYPSLSFDMGVFTTTVICATSFLLGASSLQPAFAVSRMLGTDAAVTWSTTLPP